MQVRETQCLESASEDCTFSSTDPQQLCSVTLQSSLNNKSPAYARVSINYFLEHNATDLL